MSADERLARLVRAAATGQFPPPDAETVLLPRPSGPVSAVLGFTAHHVVAADVDQAWLDAHRDARDLGSVLRAPFLNALAERVHARAGHLDLVLVAERGLLAGVVGSPELVDVDSDMDGDVDSDVDSDMDGDPAGTGHPRADRARAYRTAVRVARTTDGSGVVVAGRGLGGRWEIAFELDASARGRGRGAALAAAATQLVPAGQPVFAQVSPGNVASVRALLRAGFWPIGSEVLLHHSRGSGKQGFRS